MKIKKYIPLYIAVLAVMSLLFVILFGDGSLFALFMLGISIVVSIIIIPLMYAVRLKAFPESVRAFRIFMQYGMIVSAASFGISLILLFCLD